MAGYRARHGIALDAVNPPLLDEPWVLDVDATIKPLHGHPEGAVVGYNPHKPERRLPSQKQAYIAITPICLRICD